LARQGIFRFFPGVNSANADVTSSGTGNNIVTRVVDSAGNPLDPATISANIKRETGANVTVGPLQSFNVFGDSLNPGDPFRKRIDPRVYVTKLLNVMPLPNAYDGAATIGGVPVDGLNTAVIRWVRRTTGGSPGGTGENIDAYNRKQINIKIDHNFNQRNRLSGTWVHESHYSDNNDTAPWPTGVPGEIREKPNVRTLNFTTTLTPNLLNEARYAYRSTSLEWTSAIETPGQKEKAISYLPVINGYPVYIRPAMFPNHVV